MSWTAFGLQKWYSAGPVILFCDPSVAYTLMVYCCKDCTMLHHWFLDGFSSNQHKVRLLDRLATKQTRSVCKTVFLKNNVIYSADETKEKHYCIRTLFSTRIQSPSSKTTVWWGSIFFWSSSGPNQWKHKNHAFKQTSLYYITCRQ